MLRSMQRKKRGGRRGLRGRERRRGGERQRKRKEAAAAAAQARKREWEMEEKKVKEAKREEVSEDHTKMMCLDLQDC